MGYNYNSAEATRAKNRRAAALVNRFEQGDVQAAVTSVSSSTEEVTMTSVPSKVAIVHPYVSVSSWDRAMPEVGSMASVQYNKEARYPIMTQYRNEQADKMVSDYNSGNNLYRELASGELDRMSVGMANTWHANKPFLFQRAGLVENTLDGIDMTMYTRAPTHVRRMHLFKTGKLEDQELLGIVRRTESAIKSPPVKIPIDEGSSFAKEHTLVLTNSTGILIDRREGDVCEDNAKFPVHPITGKYLRLRERLYSTKTLLNPAEQYLEKQVDIEGNLQLDFPNSAKEGLCINIPKGRFVGSVGLDTSLTLSDNVVVTMAKDHSCAIEGKQDITVQGDVTYKADKKSTMSIGGFLTKLGIDGTHPLVFGDELVKNLLTFLVKAAVHTHPGVPPSPDFSTACIELSKSLPDCISQNVTTK